MVVTCPVFATYITRKEEEHTADGVEYTPESLMAMVEKYYETLMIRKMWTASTPHDEQVFALTAEIAALKAGRKPGPKIPRDPAINKSPPNVSKEKCTLAPPVGEPKTSPPNAVTPKMTFAQAAAEWHMVQHKTDSSP
jgi:hypothetical protein